MAKSQMQLTLSHIQVKQTFPPYSTYKSLVCNSSPQKFILKIHLEGFPDSPLGKNLLYNAGDID